MSEVSYWAFVAILADLDLQRRRNAEHPVRSEGKARSAVEGPQAREGLEQKSESPTRIPGEAPTCASWCGRFTSDLPRGQANVWYTWPKWEELDPIFCSESCRDNRKPLNPRTSVTGSGTP